MFGVKKKKKKIELSQINSITNIFTDLEGHTHSVPPNVHTKKV